MYILAKITGQKVQKLFCYYLWSGCTKIFFIADTVLGNKMQKKSVKTRNSSRENSD